MNKLTNRIKLCHYSGDNCGIRQPGGTGLLACQKLLGNLVSALPCQKENVKPNANHVSQLSKEQVNITIGRFGENGYFKIKRGTGHCGVSTSSIFNAVDLLTLETDLTTATYPCNSTIDPCN